MAIHMSIRLAWHDNGWNGHICQKPRENSYCVGQYSYPGNMIASIRDLDFENNNCGKACKNFPCQVACALSVNAFGEDTIKAKVDPPDFFKGFDHFYKEEPLELDLPPHTACTWCYEKMFSDEVKTNGKLDNDKRKKVAEDYFAQFEPDKSLIFYYAGYSNPFSENEENNYVVVGLSRLHKIEPFQFYPNITESISDTFAGGLVWQKPITSNYPEEGFCIPYQKYMDDEDILNKIVVKPSNRAPFKYGSREVSNDDAIEVINQLIAVVDTLIEIGDTSQDWNEHKNWLNRVLVEIWQARGPYPGFPAVLENLGMETLISDYINLTDYAAMKNYVADVRAFLDGADNAFAQKFPTPNKIRRSCKLLGKEKLNFLFNVLSRFDLQAAQVKAIIADNRENVSVTATIAEMIQNPYIIFEQYVGYDADDTIPLYKIDNGVIPSPNYGIDNLLDADSAERFRAFCVDELKKIPAHSFVNALTTLNNVNARIDRLPDWKKATFQVANFDVDKDILDAALVQKNTDDALYLYLKETFEDERTIEDVLTSLADRADIQPKLVISPDKFKNSLKITDSPLEKNCPEEYEKVLDNQAAICMKIFTKPLCVISGNAGTGKTTVIRAILDNIERVHGKGTSFQLLAPTGKAAERIKVQTGKSASTIHSFLAQNGWINDNFTLKRSGGKEARDFNTIIIDECSMIDLNLFATLFRAINLNSIQRLILIGDPNQLPPIGRGKVFVDTISWLKKIYPDNIGTLTDNVRQMVNRVTNKGCGILELAEVFIQEKQQTLDAEELKLAKETIFEKILLNGNGAIDKDLEVYFWEDQDALEKILFDTITNHLENIQKSWNDIMEDNPETIQVISPYRGEIYGTGSINLFMQKSFKSYGLRKLVDGIGYSDKVIQIINRPRSNMAYAYGENGNIRAEIYNGEIGRVIPHGFDRGKRLSSIKRFQVIFSGSSRQGLRYNYGKELGKYNDRYIPEQKVADNLELAYAISVHKAQGSEFDYVYVVLPKRDSHLLSMELLYTALTRAQKKVVVLLQEDISSLTSMSRVEKSAVRKINSSVFEFSPLPEDVLYLDKPWFAAGKKISTLSNYFVRSKSEAIIANLLVDRNIPFRYEEPLYAADGTMFLPDFTVTFKGEDFYWEHLGLLHNPKYKAHWEKKKAWYEKNFPGKLLTTQESNNLTKEAEAIIAAGI